MIKLQDYTPDVYYSESRDFQFIGRLFDLVLNYSKTNADILYNLPLSKNSDDQFVELLALTLGFKAKHNYTAKHLKAVCSVFSEIIKNKGTIKAIKIACQAIFHSEGITRPFEYEIDNENHILTIYIPPELQDTTLLLDLCDYVLPAGLSCNMVKLVLINKPAYTPVAVRDVFRLLLKDGSITRDPANKNYEYSNVKLATIQKYYSDNATGHETNLDAGIINTGDAIKALAGDLPGLFAGELWKKDENN